MRLLVSSAKVPFFLVNSPRSEHEYLSLFPIIVGQPLHALQTKPSEETWFYPDKHEKC